MVVDHEGRRPCAAIDPPADPTTRTRNVYLTLDDPPAAFRLGITIAVTLSRPVSPRIDLPVTALLEQGRQDAGLDGRPGRPARWRCATSTVVARDDDA